MLTNRDLERALHCIGALIQAEDHEQFVATLVRVLHPLMRARVTGYNEADPERKRFAFVIHPREFVSDELIRVWVQNAHENPILIHAQKNPGDSTVRKITDFVPQAEFRKTALCRKLYRRMNAEYQIAMPFPMPGTAAIAIVFNRDNDFTKRDRELLTLLQPMVLTAYRNVQRMTDLQFSQEQLQSAVDAHAAAVKSTMDRLDLSRRQQEVLEKLIEGQSNKQIAAYLKLSIRTVEKYVEQLLRKLKVPTRAAAMVKMQNMAFSSLK
jgi:DNA-binding CsgD family transcriptional regulator